MCTSTPIADLEKSAAGDVLIPLIRAAATIGFAIAPCSLGFVIIAVSEHLIRSIMVGDEPEMLVSDLQNQFPNDVIEIMNNDDAGLVTEVVDLIERTNPSIGAAARYSQHGFSDACMGYLADSARRHRGELRLFGRIDRHTESGTSG